MHKSASTFVDNWSVWSRQILGDLDWTNSRFRRGPCAGKRGVPDALALLRLALARGPGGLSLRDAAAWAHLAQVAKLTDASLNDRLHQSCEFLAAVAAAMLQAKTPGCCFRWPGRVLRISDGSGFSKPGSKGTDWRVHAVYDLGAGGFSHFELTDKHGAEASIAEPQFAEKSGSPIAIIRTPKVCGACARASARPATPTIWSGCAGVSLRLRGADDKKFDLAEHLRNMPADKPIDDLVVSVEGAGAPMRTRIVIRRKSEEAAQAERQRLLSQARKKGKTSRSAQPARRRICRAGDLPGRRDLSRRRTFRHVSPALADRTRFQETEEFVEPRSLAGSNRKRRAKLDLGASRSSPSRPTTTARIS